MDPLIEKLISYGYSPAAAQAAANDYRTQEPIQQPSPRPSPETEVADDAAVRRQEYLDYLASKGLSEVNVAQASGHQIPTNAAAAPAPIDNDRTQAMTGGVSYIAKLMEAARMQRSRLGPVTTQPVKGSLNVKR